MDFQTETEFAIKAVRAAAGLLTPYLDDERLRSDSARRKAAGEVVTEADHAINAFLIERLRQGFPDDAICAEEGSPHDDVNAQRRWIIDPIDGTRSFVKGDAGYSLMLALAVEGVPALGVVHDPVENRTWYAVRGGGVHLLDGGDDERVQAAGTEPRLIWSPYADPANGERLRTELGLRALDPVESFGLRAIELALDGAGVFASRPGSPNVWDTAAAWVIVNEAGGTMTGYDGEPLRYWKADSPLHPQGAVASRGVDHGKVLELIGKYLPKR
jgi:myo-inositol-1(or 4)-monophosphatase